MCCALVYVLCWLYICLLSLFSCCIVVNLIVFSTQLIVVVNFQQVSSCSLGDMAFNLSGVDISKYYDINTAVSISLFSILVLPPLLLCVLCVLALVFAKEINSKIHLLLINIFAVEICKWISYTLFYLGLPIRLLYQDSVTCKLFVSFSFIAAQIFVAVAFYAIHVYIFIKYGEKKLKWTVVIPLLIVSWTVHIAAAIVNNNFNNRRQ